MALSGNLQLEREREGGERERESYKNKEIIQAILERGSPEENGRKSSSTRKTYLCLSEFPAEKRHHFKAGSLLFPLKAIAKQL